MANRNDRPEDVLTSFRVEGEEAETWHPVTGEIAWLRSGARLMLDLGDVKELAEVSVNRMIGDQERPREKRFTFSTYDPYDKTSPFGSRTGPNELLASGLLGPVTPSAVTRP